MTLLDTSVGKSSRTATGKSSKGSDGSSAPTSVESTVLAYRLNNMHLTASLVDTQTGQDIGEPASMQLDEVSAEQIGLTVPVLWRLIDDSRSQPESVILLGDVDMAIVPPILGLALGVPIIETPHVDSVDEQGADEQAADTAVTPVVAASPPAAKSAAAKPVADKPVADKPVAAKPVPAKRPSVKTAAAATVAASTVAASTVAAPTVETPKSSEVETPESVEADSAEPAVDLVKSNDPPTEEFAVVPASMSTVAYGATAGFDSAAVAAQVHADSPRAVGAGPSHRGKIIAAALGALVLAGGIVGFALSGNGSEPPVTPTVASVPAGDSIPTADNAAVVPPSAVVAPPTAAIAPPAAAVAPPTDAVAPPADSAPDAAPAPVAPAPRAAAPWTSARQPSSAAVAPSSTAVEPLATLPPFAIPAPVPDPNNPNATLQELQDKAWADHWAQTEKYYEQQNR